MAVHPERSLHPIRVLHAVVCLGLALGSAGYAWRNHPARGIPQGTARRSREAPLPRGLPGVLSGRFGRVRALLPDAVGGLGVLGLFALGTGVYARRLEVWLEAHQAGEAAALRGVGLDRAALGANKDRKKGAIL